MEILEGVIHLGLWPRQTTPSSISIILQMILSLIQYFFYDSEASLDPFCKDTGSIAKHFTSVGLTIHMTDSVIFLGILSIVKGW